MLKDMEFFYLRISRKLVYYTFRTCWFRKSTWFSHANNYRAVKKRNPTIFQVFKGFDIFKTQNLNVKQFWSWMVFSSKTSLWGAVTSRRNKTGILFFLEKIGKLMILFRVHHSCLHVSWMESIFIFSGNKMSLTIF